MKNKKNLEVATTANGMINRDKLSLLFLSLFFVFSLFNPVFQKYDYGAGWPVVIIFGVLLFILAMLEFRKSREKSFFEKFFLLIFAGSMIASFAFSQTKNIGLSEVLAFLSAIVFYLLYAHQKISWRNKFLKLIALSAIFASMLGMIFYLIYAEPRMFGPFFNILDHSNKWPNAFALFLLMSWPIFFIAFKKEKSWKIVLPLSLVFSALLLTFSRGALIAFGGQALLLFIFFRSGINWRVVLSAILTVVFSLGLFFGMNFLRGLNQKTLDVSERATFSNEEKTTSVQERWEFFTGAVDLIKEKPFFGWGPSSFRSAYSPIQTTFLANADHPHNIFLKIGAENGLVALAAFLGFLISVFVLILKRFKNLTAVNKKVVLILSIAVLGAFAHNLIDYNFNFFQNLFILFIFLIFIRSSLIKKERPSKKSFLLIFSVLIALFSLYEGGILFLSKTYNESILQYSLFPRNYYLNEMEKDLKEENFAEFFGSFERETNLNPLDAQAYYLKGVLYCGGRIENYQIDIEMCFRAFEKALDLNSMNEFNYYSAYLETGPKYKAALMPQGRALEWDESKFENYKQKAINLLENYFDYVKNNVHFTAYTDNVEAAAEVVDLLKKGMTSEDARDFQIKKEEMLETADYLRQNKTF